MTNKTSEAVEALASGHSWIEDKSGCSQICTMDRKYIPAIAAKYQRMEDDLAWINQFVRSDDFDPSEINHVAMTAEAALSFDPLA